jgi:hypothetical protein
MDERRRDDEHDTDRLSESGMASGAAGGTAAAAAAGAQGAAGGGGDDSLLGPGDAEGGAPSSGDSTFTS